jgi:hypothetical protein
MKSTSGRLRQHCLGHRSRQQVEQGIVFAAIDQVSTHLIFILFPPSLFFIGFFSFTF